jgi:hypothetical protein
MGEDWWGTTPAGRVSDGGKAGLSSTIARRSDYVAGEFRYDTDHGSFVQLPFLMQITGHHNEEM